MMKIYEKLCELKGCSSLTGRVIEQKIRYAGTRYPEINKRVIWFKSFHAVETIIAWIIIPVSYKHLLMFALPVFLPHRSSASSTVQRHTRTLRITRTSCIRCCEPTSVTTCVWAGSSWTRSPRRPSGRQETGCRSAATWIWSTTSAHASQTPTSLVRPHALT